MFRNCIVGKSYLVKVCDLGIGRLLYPSDYFSLENEAPANEDLAIPIRWMAWESVLLVRKTIKLFTI